MLAEYYPTGLKVGGSFDAVDAPFAQDAYRLENGVLTAGVGARAAVRTFERRRSWHIPTSATALPPWMRNLALFYSASTLETPAAMEPGMRLTFEAFKFMADRFMPWKRLFES